MDVYLDHNATTPVAAEAIEAMLPYLGVCFGNPSSPHRFGREASRALARAREQVAALVGVHPCQVIFTSGGTEANNLAIRGSGGSAAIIVSAIEHPSVIVPAQVLAQAGRTVAYAPVDNSGRVDLAALEALLSAHDGVDLVSVMLANNETGVVQDIACIAAMARRFGALVHTDAAQAAGRMALDFAGLGVALMTLSSQKIYGPKGAGALIVDRRIDIEPILYGGGHERGLRAGTENVPAIVGFGVAAELARQRLTERRDRLVSLRQYLDDGLRRLPGVVFFASDTERLPNTTCLAIPGIDGETLAMILSEQGFACSSGSACSSGGREPSHVLTAMGVPAELAVCALRISLGDTNDRHDVDALLVALETLIERLAPTGLAVGA